MSNAADSSVTPPPRRASRLQPVYLGYLGLFGFLGFLHPTLRPLRLLFLSSLLYLAITIVKGIRGIRSAQQQQAAQAKQPQAKQPQAKAGVLPLPGPASRRGLGWFMAFYTVSATLTLINPVQLVLMLRAMMGQAAAAKRVGGGVIDAKAYRQQIAYILPFTGSWFVASGGVTQATSHSWDVLNQRYAYDFFVADDGGLRHPAQAGNRPTDYFAFGRPVNAPADGVVVRVRDGVRTAPLVGTGWIDWMCLDFRGNHVSIKHAEGEYSFFAHLIAGSILVKPGQSVQRGQEIGRCGHSGHSTEPHLHFHIQDQPDFFTAAGLPVQFSDVSVNGQPVTVAYLESGMRVEHPSGGIA